MKDQGLFSAPNPTSEPLAERLRPRTLDEYLGQSHILGPGKLLRRVIESDRLGSIILSGPPGTGKTTLARLISRTSRCPFVALNAVLSGVKDLREVIAAAESHLEFHGKATILFVDEVHRWNKSQQDALLPAVERGVCVLIGATTENPFFEVNPALISRSRVFILKPLGVDELGTLCNQVLLDPRGYGPGSATRPQWVESIEITEEARDFFIQRASGDARVLLNGLELAIEGSFGTQEPRVTIDIEAAQESIQQSVYRHERSGDSHYDMLSALIKSIRGSDPDGALFWTTRLVEAGEHPPAIFRRLIISASEDVGLADPQALVHTEAAARAFDRVGMPEGVYGLTQAVLYLALAPKSNSTMAWYAAQSAARTHPNTAVPIHLKDSHRDSDTTGDGIGYLYPHAFEGNWVAQRYLPSALAQERFYQGGSNGAEGPLWESHDRRWHQRYDQLSDQGDEPEGGYAKLGPSDPSASALAQASPQEQQLLAALGTSLGIRSQHRVLLGPGVPARWRSGLWEQCAAGQLIAVDGGDTVEQLLDGGLVVLPLSLGPDQYQDYALEQIDRWLWAWTRLELLAQQDPGSLGNIFTLEPSKGALLIPSPQDSSSPSTLVPPDRRGTDLPWQALEEAEKTFRSQLDEKWYQGLEPWLPLLGSEVQGEVLVINHRRSFSPTQVEGWLSADSALGALLDEGDREQLQKELVSMAPRGAVPWKSGYRLYRAK